jgi:hypothetical protein
VIVMRFALFLEHHWQGMHCSDTRGDTMCDTVFVHGNIMELHGV